MNREEKAQVVAQVTESLQTYKNFVIVDISELTVIDNNNLRRLCHSKGITLQVVKNTLIEKALQNLGIDSTAFQPVLKGFSSIMLSESRNATAKLIKEFRKKSDRPVLKAAYIDDSLYIGDDKLDTLINLKSKEELLGELIGLLQSPIKNVISGLQGGGHKIAGIVKTLSERNS